MATEIISATLAQRIDAVTKGCKISTNKQHLFEWHTHPPVKATANVRGEEVEGTLYTCHTCNKKVFVPTKWVAVLDSVKGRINVRKIDTR